MPILTKEEHQRLLNEWKNLSLKKKVELIKASKEIDKKYGFEKKSNSQKRKWRKENPIY